MATDDRHMPFETAHPAVPALYLVGMLALTMFSPQPLIVLASLLGALAASFGCRGLAVTLRGLVWQLLMLALVCVANPLFSASGSTLLLRLGPMAVYAESLAYGATMGAMLVAVLLWFEVGARLLPQDRLMSLLGGAMPTVTLMVSMTARLVPQLVRRAQTVRASEACIVAPGTQGSAVRGRTRLVGVLLGWSLEDSLERADAMRARGWAASARRTSYRQHELGGSDVVALVALSVALLCCALLAGVACSQWRFYPTMPRLVAWWGYLPILAVALLPAILCAREAIAWRR